MSVLEYVTWLMEGLQVWGEPPPRSWRFGGKAVRRQRRGRDKRPSRCASESAEDRAAHRDAATWFRWFLGGLRASGLDVFRSRRAQYCAEEFFPREACEPH